MSFLAFFILPAVLIYLANTYLVKTDATAALMFDELKSSKEMYVVFVGSSVVKHGINPEIIKEQTGFEAFDLSLGHMGRTSAVTALKQMFKTQHPEHVVLMLDPEMIENVSKNMVPQSRLTPQLKNPIERLQYYLDLCSTDQRYLERLLVFRSMPALSWKDIHKTLDIHKNPQTYIEQITADNSRFHYMGNGYLRTYADEKPQKYLSYAYPYAGVKSGLHLDQGMKNFIFRVQSICENIHADLTVLLSPLPTVFTLANASDRVYYTLTSDFCKQIGILCYNLALTRNCCMPSLNDYFYDFVHLSSKSSDLLSTYISDLLQRSWSGILADTDFFDSWKSYDASIHTVVNTYLESTSTQSGQFYATARSNHGLNIIPLYRFSVKNEDGSETILRDYSSDASFCCDASLVSGKPLLIYARAESQKTPVLFYSKL